MKYDLNIHIPQQLESFLNAWGNGDADSMARIKKNMDDLIKDETFQKDIKDYDSNRQKKLDELMKKALDGVKTAAQAEKLDEIYIDIEEIKNDLNEALAGIESEYWNSIRTYIVEWISRMENG